MSVVNLLEDDRWHVAAVQFEAGNLLDRHFGLALRAMGTRSSRLARIGLGHSDIFGGSPPRPSQVTRSAVPGGSRCPASRSRPLAPTTVASLWSDLLKLGGTHMRCAKCGASIELGAGSCGLCGFPVDRVSSTQEVWHGSTPAQPQGQYVPRAGGPPPEKSDGVAGDAALPPSPNLDQTLAAVPPVTSWQSGWQLGVPTPPPPHPSTPAPQGTGFPDAPTAKRGNKLPKIVFAAVLALLVIAAALVVFMLKPGQSATAPTAARSAGSSAPTAASSAGSSAPTSASATATPAQHSATPSRIPTPTPLPTPSKDPNETAKRSLDSLVQADSSSLSYDGRYVAQLASKALGTVDPLDPPPSGSPTWTWLDIHAQHMALRQDPRLSGGVRVLFSTSFGAAVRTQDGQPYYVTIYDGGFSSASSVESWCQSTFAELPADVLANSCVAARLKPA